MHLKAQAALNNYRKRIKKNPDTWLLHCKNQKSLSDAIQCSVMSENHQGKRNSHQYRLKKENLEVFAEHLKTQEERLSKAESFDIIFKLVENIGTKDEGIGEMLIYDTAERIGHYLNILPDKIYLHAGAREGAEKLLGKRIQEKFIKRDILPEPLKSCELTCTDIESLLCVYKDKL
jgi:hypothetical protein